MAKDSISIIGGGIAGLSIAIAAAKSGRIATIYEKAEKFDPVGAGLQLGPNAIRALQELGAWEAVEPITTAPPAIHMRDGKSGRLLKEIELGRKFETRYGLPYRVAHRADLHAALLMVAQNHQSIKIKMHQDKSPNDLPQAEHVIAADGVWSKTRTQIFAKSTAITVSDITYRGLHSFSKVQNVNMDCVNLWLYPHGHVVHYPVGQDRRLNLVAITQGQAPPLHFAKACTELLDILNACPNWSIWPLAYVPPLSTWTKGNVTLAGDAAHGTLPYLAQGAAMALEDAAALASTNFNYTNYYMKRASRTRKLHTSSLRAGKIYHAAAAIANARNLAIMALPEPIFSANLDWIYAG